MARWRAKQQGKAGGPQLVWMDVPLQVRPAGWARERVKGSGSMQGALWSRQQCVPASANQAACSAS